MKSLAPVASGQNAWLLLDLHSASLLRFAARVDND